MHIKDTNIVMDILDTPIVHQRWSASIYTYNLLSRCLKQRPRMIGELTFANHWVNTINNIIQSPICLFEGVISYIWSSSQAIGAGFILDKLGLIEVFDNIRYTSKNPLIKKLWKLIYEEFREKSLLLDDLEVASLVGKSRGEWVLFEIF